MTSRTAAANTLVSSGQSGCRVSRSVRSSALATPTFKVIVHASRSSASIATVDGGPSIPGTVARSEEHTSELPSLMRTSYAVLCLKTKTDKPQQPHHPDHSLSDITIH